MVQDKQLFQCRRKLLKVAIFSSSFARAMSSSESVEVKRKSESNASCNSCEVLFNSRAVLQPPNGLQDRPRGLILPGIYFEGFWREFKNDFARCASPAKNRLPGGNLQQKKKEEEQKRAEKKKRASGNRGTKQEKLRK